jgi:DNA-binding IclR family transcriptional regulator
MTVLANVPAGERDRHLERARERLERAAYETLADRLAEIRSRGYAIQGIDDETTPAVATHIPGPDAEPVGAIDAELEADAEINIGTRLAGLLTGLANDLQLSLLD